MPWGEVAALLLMIAGGVVSSWLAGRILPFDRATENTTELASLSQRYRRWQLAVVSLWFFVLLPAASMAVWRLLMRFAERRRSALGAAEIAFFPGTIEIAFPEIFLGAVVSIVLLWLGVRIYLGQRYAEYRRYERLQWGIGAWTPWLSLIGVSVASLLAAAAMIDCYAVFTADRIRINEFLSAGERSYGYEQVRLIHTAPKWIALAGNEVKRQEYVLCFQDGYSWNTSNAPGVVSQRDRRLMAELVSAKSKAPIVGLPLLTREQQSCR